MEIQSVGFVGGGRITRVLLERLARREGTRVVVSDNDGAAGARLAAAFPTVETTADNRVAAAQDLVFLALHPPALKSVLPQLAGALRPDAVVVSLAPVLTIAALSALAARFVRLARMIPNAPSLLGHGYNPVAYAAGLAPDERRHLEALFDLWGAHPEVEEATLEAYAVLTAWGRRTCGSSYKSCASWGRGSACRELRSTRRSPAWRAAPRRRCSKAGSSPTTCSKRSPSTPSRSGKRRFAPRTRRCSRRYGRGSRRRAVERAAGA